MSRLTKAKGPIAGVCAGLGKNLNIDPTIIRIAFVLTSLFMGLPILIYIVLAVALPKEEDVPSFNRSVNQPITSDQLASTPSAGATPVASSVIYCRNCGHQNDAKGKFCRKCGSEL